MAENKSNISNGASGNPEQVLENTLQDLIDRAQVEYEKGNLEGALNFLDQAILTDPGSAEAFNNRGLVKTSLKQYADAITDLTTAITFSPEFEVAYLNRGIAYYDT